LGFAFSFRLRSSSYAGQDDPTKSGLPILPNLPRYETVAVAYCGCMSHALHIRQTRQSLNLGENVLRGDMIVSYHPSFESEKNIVCAGRDPGPEDLAAIRAADAVVLPQGCKRSLYEMAHRNCTNVFPNFNTRFNYAGKIGQARLFGETNTAHPETRTFLSVDGFFEKYEALPRQAAFEFPLVFKFNWGGEGDHVYLMASLDDLDKALQTAVKFEKSGRSGFLLQKHIPSGNRSLRVVVIGQTYISYWRIHHCRESFQSGLAKGAVIDADSDPDLQHAAITKVKAFCRDTGINLAGFDVLFASEPENNVPLLLEINYYFGRRGLGGSERFYEILNTEIHKWIDGIGLPCRKK